MMTRLDVMWYDITFQSFKEHELIEDIFKYPGEADITANVDFAFLKRMCHNKGKHILIPFLIIIL